MGSCQRQAAPRFAPISSQQKAVIYEGLEIVLFTRGNSKLKTKPITSKLQQQILQDKSFNKQLAVSLQQQSPNQAPNDYRCLLLVFQKCHQAYHEHDLDTSYEHIKEFQALKLKIMRENNIAQNILQGVLQNQYLQWKRDSAKCNLPPYDRQLLKQIQIEYRDILHYEDQINRGQWQEKHDFNGIKTFTRRQGNTVGVLIEANIDIPFQIFITVLTEIDLYKEFIPFNEISRQQKIFSRNCRIGYNLNNYPFLAKRQAFFQGIGYSRLKTKQQLFLFTRSIHNRQDLQDHLGYEVRINPDYVQLNYKYFVVKYRPLGVGNGRLTMALNADMGLQFLPMFMLQYLVKDFAESFLQSLVDISHRFKDSQWQKNVQKNPELFQFFKREIDKYLKENSLDK